MSRKHSKAIIITEYRKSNKTLAYVMIAFGLILMSGLISSIGLDRLYSNLILFIALGSLFFGFPAYIIMLKKTLTIKEDILTVRSNFGGTKTLDLRTMIKWIHSDVRQRYQLHHGIIHIMKPDRRVLRIRESEFEEFSKVLHYFRIKYSHKQVQNWKQRVRGE